jgi:hypothetical protein
MTKGLLEGFNVEDLSFHPIVEVVERVLKSLSLYKVLENCAYHVPQ